MLEEIDFKKLWIFLAVFSSQIGFLRAALSSTGSILSMKQEMLVDVSPVSLKAHCASPQWARYYFLLAVQDNNSEVHNKTADEGSH